MITRSASRTIRFSTPWMCDCGCLSTQPWWRPYSVACTVTSHGTPKRRASSRRGVGHQPVVRVHEVERAVEVERGGQHVGVHVLDPGDEGVEVVLGEVGLAHAVHGHAVAVLGLRQPPAAARDHVHLDPERHELLGQLADVPGQPALDDRRVLPREDQDAHGARGYLRFQRRRAGERASASAVTSSDRIDLPVRVPGHRRRLGRRRASRAGSRSGRGRRPARRAR